MQAFEIHKGNYLLICRCFPEEGRAGRMIAATSFFLCRNNP